MSMLFAPTAEDQEELRRALARLAINFVFGPGAVTSALRRALLDAPLNGMSTPASRVCTVGAEAS